MALDFEIGDTVDVNSSGLHQHMDQGVVTRIEYRLVDIEEVPTEVPWIVELKNVHNIHYEVMPEDEDYDFGYLTKAV